MLKKLLTITLSFLLLSSLTVTFAKESSESRERYNKEKKSRIEELKEKREELKEEFKAKFAQRKAEMEEKKEDRCEELTENIEKKISNYDNNKKTHVENYQNLQERLEKLIAKLDEKDYDTTELKSALEGLKPLVSKFASDYSTFISALKETQQYTCGASEGEFKAKVEEAHKLLKVVKEDAQAIREYYKDNVKPALEDLREQHKEKESTDSDN